MLFILTKRGRYVRAMMKAIDVACRSCWTSDPRGRKTDGLRVIRRFEQINNTEFDPFNSTHVDTIRGWANTEGFFRDAYRILGGKQCQQNSK